MPWLPQLLCAPSQAFLRSNFAIVQTASQERKKRRVGTPKSWTTTYRSENIVNRLVSCHTVCLNKIKIQRGYWKMWLCTMQTNSLPRFSNEIKRFSWSLGNWQWPLFHISLGEGQLSRKDGNSSEKSEFQVFIQMMSETSTTASLPWEYLLWIRQTLI